MGVLAVGLAIAGGLAGGGVGLGLGFGSMLVAIQGAMLGAMLGGSLGLILDPVTGQDTSTGTADVTEFNYTTNAEGIAIPDLLGTSVLSGNLLWHGGNRWEAIQETVTTGGKGGGGGSQTTVSGYRYYISAAIGLGIGPMDALYEIWQNDILVWEGKAEPGEDGSVDLILDEIGSISFHFGTPDQTVDSFLAENVPDPTLQSAWKNICYVVFKDVYIGQYNRLPNFKFVLRKTPALNHEGIDTRIDTYDYNPIAAAHYLLNQRAELPLQYLDRAAFISRSKAIDTEKLGISGVIKTDAEAGKLVSQILSHVDGFLRYVATSRGGAAFEPVLLRDTGDRESLPAITENDIIGKLDFQRPSWGATECNELAVTYQKRLKEFRETSEEDEDGDPGSLLLGFAKGNAGLLVVAYQGFSTGDENFIENVILSEGSTLNYRCPGIEWTGKELVVMWRMWDGSFIDDLYIYGYRGFTDQKTLEVPTGWGIYEGDLGWTGSGLLHLENDDSVDLRSGLSSVVDERLFVGDINTIAIVGITASNDGDLIVARQQTDGYQIVRFSGISTEVAEVLSYGSAIKALAWVENDLVVLTDTSVIRYDGFSLDVVSGPFSTYHGEYGYATAVAWSNTSAMRREDWEEGDVEVDGLPIKQSSIYLDDPANKRITGRSKPQTLSCPWFPKEESALWLGIRTIAKGAFPGANIRFTGNRHLYRYQVGDRFRLYYSPYGIEDMIFRITSLEEEDLQEETIHVTAEQAIEYLLSVPDTVPVGFCEHWSHNLCLDAWSTASASSAEDGHAAEGACDGSITSRWQSGTGVDEPVWWQMDFGEGVEYAIEQVKIKAVAGNNMNCSIKTFRLLGQHDYGGAFSLIFVGRHENNGDWQTYEFKNSIAYRKYRIEIVDQWTDTFTPGLWEVEMRECNEATCYYPAEAGDDGFCLDGVFHNDTDYVTVGTEDEEGTVITTTTAPPPVSEDVYTIEPDALPEFPVGWRLVYSTWYTPTWPEALSDDEDETYMENTGEDDGYALFGLSAPLEQAYNRARARVRAKVASLETSVPITLELLSGGETICTLTCSVGSTIFVDHSAPEGGAPAVVSISAAQSQTLQVRASVPNGTLGIVHITEINVDLWNA